MLKKSKKQTWDLAKTRENSIFAVALVCGQIKTSPFHTQVLLMMRRRLYIYSLWLATCSVLLSTVVLHHHHFNRICFVEQRCAEDGNTNDEHTEHHEKEHEGCSVHQMHQFIVNAKVAKNIQQKIFDGGHHLMAVLPSHIVLFPLMNLVIVSWQETTSQLHGYMGRGYNRRGPPCLA